MGKSLLNFRKPKQLELEEYLDKLARKGLDKDGRLIPDSVPLAPPIGYKKQPSMVEIVREMVKSERLAEEARRAGHETFEESEDFDVGDDPELLRSPFENEFDPPLDEILAAGREALASREANQAKGDDAAQGEPGSAPPKSGADQGRPGRASVPEKTPTPALPENSAP